MMPSDRRGWLRTLLVIGFLVVGVIIVVGVCRRYFPSGTRSHAWYTALSAVIGGLVGGSELMSRYRDEPTRALVCPPAVAYVALNATISACAYGLLTKYSETIIPGLEGDKLMTALTGGFAAMAILRSKFFTLRTENGEDVAVGPDAAISAFLSAADRGVDRVRAANRLELVFHKARAVTAPEKGRDFIEASLAAFQNLSDEEKSALTGKIEAIYGTKYPEDLKLQAMCYGVLNLTGERDFNQVMTNLVDYAS
jgi:hypothetical protein